MTFVYFIQEESLKVGIIGYEGSGKTTIFGALSGVDPAELVQQKQQIREVRVPDSRIDALSAMYNPKKTIYATIQFVDVMSGAAVGKGLDGNVLGKIREADLLAIVVRGFSNGYSDVEPAREARSMLSELLLSDMEIVERKVSRMQKEKASEQEKAQMIKENSAYGKIICRCEGVTEGEILDAIHRNPKPSDLDCIKRRTRAQMGRCQGGFCGPQIVEILARELGVPYESITKFGGKSTINIGKTKGGQE
jgi:bacterioferritin-associated ferredoxin